MRFGAYIDGFNLFYGLKSYKWRKYYWLNVYSLCDALKPKGSTLSFVKYYTSPSKDLSHKPYVVLSEALLKEHQFPDEIKDETGKVLARRPTKWR